MRTWLLPSVLAAAGVVAAAYLLGLMPPSEVRRPNVIIYLVDTLRADHLGVYGYERDTSPALDRWAKDAVVFEHAYSPTSWTRSATVSLLTGLDPLTHRVEGRLDTIPSGIRLLSERLKQRGYGTFAVVTNPNVLPEFGFDRGFDLYHDMESGGGDTGAEAVIDYVSAKISAFAQTAPFFLYLHLLDPHKPYDPPAPFGTRFRYGSHDRESGRMAAYDGEIAYGDSQFQRMLDLLRANDLYDDTIIVFVSDHGEELLDHGRWGHGTTLYEEVIRVPLLIKLPGSKHRGKRIRTRVSLIDIVPTVMSALGEPPVPG